MFSGLFVVVALVVLPFRVQASTSIMTANSTSATVAPCPPLSPSTSSPPGDLTCFRICFTLDKPWSKEYANKSSPSYNDLADGVKFYNLHSNDCEVSFLLGSLFEPHGTHVTVEKLSFTESDDNLVRVQEDICLVVDVKIGTPFLEDVFERGMENVTPKYCFEPLGVTFSEWKAKDGECESKCEGAAGSFVIEAKCKPEKHSCNGLKNKSKKTQDCVQYCGSSSMVVAVSYLILAMAISLSFSF